MLNLKSDDFKNNLTLIGFLFGTGDPTIDNMFLIMKSYIYIIYIYMPHERKKNISL